jgi:hypothetical protein
MKLWLLMTLMDILLLCTYLALIIKAEVQRIFLQKKN